MVLLCWWRDQPSSQSALKLASRTSVEDNSSMDSEEPRRRRSPDPLVALHYQLSSTRREGALDTIVVADGSGVVVAGAGSWAACEELAAFAPLIARGETFGMDGVTI